VTAGGSSIHTAPAMPTRDVLMDVSRLIWRLWRGGLPTGVDRVCLAYLEHFRSRSRAVVQRRGRHFVLRERDSDRLFDLLTRGGAGFRPALLKLGLTALPKADRAPAEKGLLYLNVGHTGLDEPSLGPWIARSGLRAVFFVHDLIPVLYPEYCRPGERARHEQRLVNALRSASGVIANSKETLSDIRAFAAGQALPMPPAVASPIAGPPIPPNTRPRGFDRPHFVIVGTIEGRKNHLLLLHIWKRMAASGNDVPLLVIIGQRGWEAESVTAMLDEATDLKQHVLELGSCSDDELAAIVAGARALLMPSFAEGFGIPIAEALALGTPVIASDLAVFREFASDIPTYLDPLDGPGWEQAIRAFVADGPERQRQLGALRNYSPSDWFTHFGVIDTWIETLMQ
jgi:glycosyltransferase involved in cell wall biosynthesis